MATYTTSSTAAARHLSDWLASLTLLPICGYYAFKGSETTILDSLCMLVYDAGRIFAGAVSGPLSHIGGTCFLIVLPAFLVWYFSARGYRFGIQVFLFWLGQNLIFLGRAAIDIESRRRHLLNEYQFDMHAILSFLEMTESADVMGQIVFMLGVATFITLLVLPLYVSR